MSYILEALKKAQAERQLGSTPTIHASQLHLAGQGQARAGRWTLYAALSCALVGLGAAGAAYLRPAPARIVQPVPAPVTGGPVAVAPAPVPVVQAQAVPSAPAPVRPAARTAPVRPAVAAVPATPPATTRALPASDDILPLMRELPGGGSGIPAVQLGGYIYSDNPADRLILVDKELRREGDLVAPGLVLERLRATDAVLNYRGTRFRVPY